MKKLTFNFKSIVQTKARWLLTFCALLTLGVGQLWAASPIYSIGDVYVRGTMNSWSDVAEWKLGNGNHCSKDFFVAKQNDNYKFKLHLKSAYYGKNGYWFTKDNSGPAWSLYSDGGSDMEIKTSDMSSSYIKLSFDFYGEYSGDSRLSVALSNVDALSASLSADATSVQGGSTTTVRGGCSGGSGSYGYSYTVTCGGSDVTATVLSGSGANRTFTAPQESTSKTYRVTITATEQNSQLTGLGFTGSNSTYVDITVPGITAPTVTMTVDKVNVNQITLTGTITAYNGYGSNASDLSEVGFYIGATKYTATYKSGNTFTMTITGLAANTSHANVKAFAKNPLTTGYSSTETVTTLADADYDVKVRVAHGASAPKVYAWTNADSYGGSKMENGTYGSQSASEDKFEATTYDWYTYKLNNKYEKFLIYETGDADKSEDFAATRTSDCYWYNKSGSPKAAKMVCPEFEPQIVINDGSTETLYEMSGDGTVTKSQTLSAGSYTIKVMYNTEYYGKGSSSIARTGSTSSNSIISMVVDGAYITLTADLAGTYTFSFNTSTKTLSVAYPEAYQVTYSKHIVGSDNGTIGAPTASYNAGATSVTSGTTWIPTGTTVNFSAPAATSGYTFKGWYSNTPNPSNWETNRIQEGASYDRMVSVAATIYAVYNEDDYTVTVNKTTGGSITTPTPPATTVTAHVSTTTAIAAAKDNEAWHFDGWTKESGSVTFTNASNLSTTIKATATSTIQANFKTRYGLVGSRKADGNPAEGMPNREGTTWENEYAADFEVISFTAVNTKNGVDLECTRTLLPNREYKFQVYDRTNNTRRGCTTSGGKTMPSGENWQLDGTNDVWLSTAGYGDYTFKITKMGEASNYYPSLEIVRPASSKLTLGWGYAGIDNTSSVSNGNTGGSVAAQTNEGSGFAITNGQYVANGSNITFTAAPATGYTLEGWYTNSDYAVENKISAGGNYAIDGNTLTVSSISADFAIYAKFVENSTAVTIAHNEHGHVEISDATVTSTTVGKTTTRTIKAVPNPGYYFAGWTVPGDADFSVDDATEAGNNGSKSTTLRGLGAGTPGTITANFVELEKVYFRNWNEDSKSALWSNVYVYFSISYENDGSSQPCAKSNSSADFYTEMEQIGSTNIYWAYVPRATTRKINPCDDDIAFSNHDFGTNFKFNGNEAVMRGDYRSGLSLFVPRHASTYSRNSTTYYNGYWKHHNLDPGSLSGYSIERYTGGTPAYVQAADNGADRLHFIVLNENTIQYSLRVDNVDNGRNNYMIYSDGGIHYVTYDESVVQTGCTITTTNYKDIHMSEYNTGSPRFYITPTTQNIYTLTIDQSGDELKLTVDYPVAKGDYRIVHTYNSGDTKKAYSDIIKSADAATGVIASMYINTNSSPTLTLEKCTAITPVTWTAQTQGNVWSTHSGKFNKGNGVYQFDVTINTDASDAGSSINSIDNVGLYDGEFYIKTDIAPGGWTAWKANIMEKNSITFDSENPKTYDYAFCHWVGNTTTNVKCVIANEYNIAVSDTLESDAILGGSSQTLPSAAHVRFSYNSTTNELKRTYLAVSGEDHLVMEGNTLSGPVYMIHNPSTHTNYDNNKATLDNLSNFTFGLDIEAREKARVRLSAKYNGTIQDLVGHVTSYGSDLTDVNTVEIMGGSIENTDYNTLHVSYDFKTNQLLSAWMAPESGNSPNKAINADVMIIRQEQGNARQITFASNEHNLSAVKKVYGVMKFTKSFILDNGESRYARDLYWISFPFDVRLSDAFGLGTYGTHWIIEYYDGKGRATNGFWADSPSNWKFVTPAMREHGGTDGQGYILNANEGYILALDLDELGGESLVWDNGMTEAYLYFPSKSDVNNIAPEASKEVPINQDGYQCTINRATPDGDRRIKDSYWHCIGAPSYANVNHDVATEDPTLGEQELWDPEGLMYFYEWNTADNSLSVRKTSPQSFKAMHSYLVQYSSTTLTWANVNKAPASVATRLTETPDREFQLALIREDEEQDHTYVRLTDDANVSNRFEFNYDLSKEYNAGRGNIWTVTADTVEVAGNSMPKPVQTTVVPVGVKVVANGEYTLAMPEGTNGEDVYLIDNAYGTRTNLGLMPYTVTLTAGTYDSRFALEFGPIQDAPTGIEQMSTVNYQLSTEEVRKVFVGGRLYIIRDGKVYDAAGQRVE